MLVRQEVRDSEHPFEVVGHVPAPPPGELVRTGFKWRTRLSKWPSNEHPRHSLDLTGEEVVLELGEYRLERGNQVVEGRLSLMSMGLPMSTLRRIPGFVPLTVIQLPPARLFPRGKNLTEV